MKAIHFLSITAIAALYSVLITNPINASTPISYQELEQKTGAKYSSDLSVYPGRISSVDFSGTDEVINYIGLGDSSKVVFHTDLPLESGTTKTIFLRPIQPLKFPGATTTLITNLVVKTRASDGTSRLYNFNIVHSKGNPANLGTQIVTQSASSRKQVANGKMKTDSGRLVSLNDVRQGLERAISKGYTGKSDPIVYKVKRFLIVAENEGMSIFDAAKVADVDITIINELAEMAYEVEPANLAGDRTQETPNSTQISPQQVTETKSSQARSTQSPNPDNKLNTETELPEHKILRPIPIEPKKTDLARSSQPNLANQIEKIANPNSSKQANDLVYGLAVAGQKGHINYGTQMYKQINSVIAMVRRGETVEKAAEVTQVSMSTLSQILKWGEARNNNSLSETITSRK
jgi:hypothetical protein